MSIAGYNFIFIFWFIIQIFILMTTVLWIIHHPDTQERIYVIHLWEFKEVCPAEIRSYLRYLHSS